MKFNTIIGNPPYQERKVTTSDNPIYHLFMDLAYKLSEKTALVTPARFLFNAGKTPNEWNQRMLLDKHFKVLWYSPQSYDVFSTIDLKGGVTITYRDKNQNFEAIREFFYQENIKEILQKVKNAPFQPLSEWVYSPESYRFSKKIHSDYPEIKSNLSTGHLYDLTTNIFKKLPNIFHEIKPDDGENYIQILGRIDNARTLRWIKLEYIEPHQNLDFFKIFLSKSNGTGELGEKLSSPVIGEPAVGHNQTFISIGSLSSSEEANNLLKYILTKFARLLLGSLKVTQDNKKDVWKNIPIQDFTENSKIDWTKSISEIDQQLYKKYSFSQNEIDFIEKTIKSME